MNKIVIKITMYTEFEDSIKLNSLYFKKLPHIFYVQYAQ